MPSLQQVDLSPRKAEPTSLENTLSTFANKAYENIQENRELDQLKQITDKYKNEGRDLDEAIMSVMTTPGITPSTRVNSINNLINVKKTHVQEAKQHNKALKEAQQDEKEKQYLEYIKDKKLSASDMYKTAKEFGLDRQRAEYASTLAHKEHTQNRLDEEAIRKSFNDDLKEIDKKIKDEPRRVIREELQKQKDELIEKRKSAIEKHRNGEVEAVQEVEQQEQDPVIQRINVLTQKQKPSPQNKGLIVKDKLTGLQFISNGKEWELYQEQQ